MDANGNGIRISNRDIYDEVTALRREVATLTLLVEEHRGRVNSLTTQVRLLWTLSFAIVGTIVTAAIKVVG